VNGETAGKLETKPVSPAQLLYAKKIAQGKALVTPDEGKARRALRAASAISVGRAAQSARSISQMGWAFGDGWDVPAPFAHSPRTACVSTHAPPTTANSAAQDSGTCLNASGRVGGDDGEERRSG